MSLFYSFLMVVLLALLGASIAGSLEPDFWYVGALAAAGVGLLWALIAWLSGPQIVLSVVGAREATPYELQVVDNVTEEMALAAGIPKPKVYVIDDPALNAFATGSNPRNGIVVVTTGLIRELNRDELQGVIAHEISHIRNQDVRLMTTLAIVAGLIPLLADVAGRMIWYSKSRKNRDENKAIWLAAGLVLAILAPLFSKLIELAVSRKREYLADASAAQLTRYPEGLASALAKIAIKERRPKSANRALEHMYIANPFKEEWGEEDTGGLFSTHPPLGARIKALRSLMGTFPERPQSS
jgi:heat shock protein HtpX